MARGAAASSDSGQRSNIGGRRGLTAWGLGRRCAAGGAVTGGGADGGGMSREVATKEMGGSGDTSME
jgi:hypothetical protein